ncbi:hypothetical protein Agub_g13905, partial [Astrephomene gubernaculifera]
MTVNAACKAALEQLREYFSSLGDKSPIRSLSLDEGGIAFIVCTPSEQHRITVCWTEADNYPNSGCILFGPEPVSELSERFQDRGELRDVVREVLRVFGIQMDIPGAQQATPAAMEEDSPAGKRRSGSDSGMDEGSDDDWDNVQSGSEDNDDHGSDGSSGQFEDEEEEQDEEQDEDDDDRDLIILCSSNMGRWERHEARLEAAAAAAAEGDAAKQQLSSMQGLAAKRQIFSSREAFAMLSRELLDFLRGRHLDCSVETEGDDLFHWVLDLGSFAEGSGMAKDMREVSRRYFYSTVRLRLRFMRGLYPFYPFAVEVVWPRLAGPLLGAVASHPMLATDKWDPFRPVMATVAQIKKYLEAHARVDLDHPGNDIRRHPHSTYSPLECGLARLEALSGVAPEGLSRSEAAELYAARDSYDKDAARLQALVDSGNKKRARPDAAGAGKRSKA